MNKGRDLDRSAGFGNKSPYSYTPAAPGHGNSDPETLGGSRKSVKDVINHEAKTKEDAVAELLIVQEMLINWGEYTHSERVLLSRREKALQHRVQGAVSRYNAVGTRKGWLTTEERGQVTYQTWLDKMHELLHI